MVAGRQAESSAVGLSGEDKGTNSKYGVAQFMLLPLGRIALLINTSRVRNMSDATGNRFYESWRVLRALATQVGLRHFARARGLRLNLVPVSSIPRPSIIAFPLVLASACLMLPSCENTDRSGTAFRTFSALGGESISIDAHQRAIITTEVHDETGRSRLIYCAEPSPDAFASISSTLNRSLAARAETAENTTQVSADSINKLTTVASHALNARNATIQLLRDGLYRACEAYATGALSKNEYVGIVGQYQNVILALLSVELLTTINAPMVAPTDKKEDEESENDTDGESKSGRSSTSGLSEGSIKIIAETAERLVNRVLNIERERALQPRFTECMQRAPEKPKEFGDVLIEWCDYMMKRIAEGSARDSSNDTLDLLDEVTNAVFDPAGDIAVGASILVHFEDGERLKVFTLKLDMDGIYEIELSNESAVSDGDPALILTTADLDVVGSDDDSGDGLNAKIAEALDASHYHIHVINIRSIRATFRLSVASIDTGMLGEHSGVDSTESPTSSLSQEEQLQVDDIIQDFVDQLVEDSRTPQAEIEIGVERRLQFTPGESMQSLIFEISSAGHYILEVSAESQDVGDPAVILLDEEGSVLDADDDSGGGLNSRIERQLSVGEYELRVLNLDSSGAALKVLLESVEVEGTSVQEPGGGRVLRG